MGESGLLRGFWGVLGLFFFPFLASSGVGQDGGLPLGVDSVSLREEAERGQARFERVRRANLPWALGGWGGECDEVVGRFCLRHSTDLEWEPPEEPRRIGEARDELLEELALAAAALPGDDWVLGQRIHYLVEGGRLWEAEGLARACGGATSWWCDALLGFVLHRQESFPASYEAFERALGGMESERAREWTDPSQVLDRDAVRMLSRASGADSVALGERIWRLGEPLFLVPGNDLWTEHLSRHVVVEMRRRARNAYGLRWGRDLAEVMVRFGWEVAWERTRASGGSVLESHTIGRKNPRGRHFFPPGEALGERDGVLQSDWRLELHAPRSRYAPSWARTVSPLESRIAVFRRGDSLLVVGAWGTGEDPGDGAVDPEAWDSFESGLIVRPASGDGPELLASGSKSHFSGESGSGGPPSAPTRYAIARVAGGPQIASVEVLDREGKRAWRYRRELRPPPLVEGVPALSDLLLHHATGETPVSPEASAPLARSGTTFAPGEVIGVAWEIYNLPPLREVLSFRLSVERERPGRLRRLGERIGLLGSPSGVVVAWSEPGPERIEPLFRSVELDLAGLEEGSWVLLLEIELRGRDPLRNATRIEIAR
jgi:hypothetical protein